MATTILKSKIHVGMQVYHPLFAEYGSGTVLQIQQRLARQGGWEVLVRFCTGPTIWLKLSECKRTPMYVRSCGNDASE